MAKMDAVADAAASTILSVFGDQGRMPSIRRAALSRVLKASVALGAALPFALSFALPNSIAIPAGLAFAAGLGLMSAGLIVSISAQSQAAPLNGEKMGQHRASALLDAMSGLMLVQDGQGIVTDMAGRDRQSIASRLRGLVGVNLIDEIHVSDRIAYLSAMDCLRQGASHASVDVRLEHIDPTGPEGQFVSLHLDMTAQYDATGQFAGWIADLSDRGTEIRQAGEIANLSSEIRTAHETKTRFLAAVSHELRTPLNAILGFSDILIGGYFGKLDDPRQIEYVNLINQSGHHLLAVVNTMLDMSKIEAGRYELFKEPFLFSDALRTVEEMMGLEARNKGLVLTARAARDIGEINADRRALSQILINLVGNAIKFTDKGGIVTVDSHVVDRNLIISVRDTGIGIPADKISALGQPFMQVSNEYTRRFEGTGLGLSLVKGLVQLHGGSMTITSVVGEGTDVTIRLPVDDVEAIEPETSFPPRLIRDTPPLDAFRDLEGAKTEDNHTEDREAMHGHKQAKTA